MLPESVLWAIFLLPIFSLIFISLILRPFFNKYPKLSGYTIIACLAAALGLSIWVFNSHDQFPITSTVEWAVIGNFEISLGLVADNLTAIMLIVVTGVSLLVQIYSQGYMKGDPGYHRYFAWMSLFTASMLGLVLASNLLLVYVFWEGVGLGSYLLIGFWFHRPSAAAAAKKAFVVTRFGDFGFLIGILILYFTYGTFNIAELNEMAIAGVLGGTTLTLAMLGIFSGAVGKSAQFPLHVWLPDAMEGPTPVSSLIHAATMVAAGVYLVARTLPMFASSETAVTMVAVIGGFTAIFAASMGLVMNDIKRVLAYSTISQLGYMMLGLGTVGVAVSQGLLTHEEGIALGITVGIFHLFTHAFFKCLLFLGAGSVNHASGTFDMRLMGGLRKYMPWTFGVFLIGSLSLAGIWPLAGFWSKDLIVLNAWEHTPILFWLAMITVFMTAFYMFRAVFMTFGGEYRGGEAGHGAHGGQSATSAPGTHSVHGSHSGHGNNQPHESPLVMVFPMVILAIMAIGCGWTFWAGGAAKFLGEGEYYHLHPEHWHPHGFFDLFTKAGEEPMPLIALVVALAGISFAYVIYSKKWISADKIGQAFAPIYTLLSRKYYFDELYERVIVVRILLNGLFYLVQLFDTYIVDGIVNGVGKLTVASGSILRRLQTGQLQGYGLAIAIGILIIVVVFFAYK
ncbi:MAG TPA: NADH-quinone oxidoreductase subunit L [Dehalococcoidia bacterium]|nr:NADH-quinone oxidoreductase subunit L [Dehalococcoidia bacterium]